MANFLVLETATDICSVALATYSKGMPFTEMTLLAERTTPDFRDHGRIITRFIEECLEEAELKMDQLTAVALSSGPGSFTSLRIGAGTAKGLCFGLGIPLMAVDTLQAIAGAARLEEDPLDTLYIPMIDARSMGVFMAIFDPDLNLASPLSRQKLDAAFWKKPLLQDRPIVCCGPAAEKYRETFSRDSLQYRPILPQAKYLFPLIAQAWEHAHFADLAYFEPNYVAPPNITTPKKKK